MCNEVVKDLEEDFKKKKTVCIDNEDSKFQARSSYL